MKKNVTKGTKIRIIGDSFVADPHNVPVGTIVEVDFVAPPVPFSEVHPMLQLIWLVEKGEPVDLPERVHVKLNGGLDYANIVEEDFELVGEAGQKIRMTENDWSEGYSIGDEFEVFEQDGELCFVDKDGDLRSVAANEDSLEFI